LNSDGDALYAIYTGLLSRFDTKPDEPHNMLLTNTWMMVIPRRRAWIDEIAANAASMVGMVWCKSEAQYEGWIERGIEGVLREMGKPWELASEKK
jgi:ATP adenylyltransferase